MPARDEIDDRRVFRFIEAQSRLDRAVAAKTAADEEHLAAVDAMQDTFANLSLVEQQLVNDAYYAERVAS